MAASSPAPSGDHVSPSAAGMAQGARAALPLAFAAGCFAATLGVLASTRGVSGTELTLMSVLAMVGATLVPGALRAVSA